MARYEVSDELWARLQPLLPLKPRRSRWPGQLPLDDRTCLNGILVVLLTGIRWTDLPQQLGYGSGMACCRRLRAWTQASPAYDAADDNPPRWWSQDPEG